MESYFCENDIFEKKKIKTHVGSVNKKHGSANSSFIESMIVRLNWI